MNASETGQIMHILKAAYPMFYAKMPAEEQKAIFGLWLDMFKEDDVRLVGSAVKALIATDSKGFPPVIGQVKEKMYALINRDNRMTDGEAWSIVKKAIRNGYYGANEEFCKLPDNIKNIVGSPEQLREWALVDSETLDTVVASNFQRGFRNYQGRTKEYDMIPGSVKSFVATLGETLSIGLLED